MTSFRGGSGDECEIAGNHRSIKSQGKSGRASKQRYICVKRPAVDDIYAP